MYPDFRARGFDQFRSLTKPLEGIWQWTLCREKKKGTFEMVVDRRLTTETSVGTLRIGGT